MINVYCKVLALTNWQLKEVDLIKIIQQLIVHLVNQLFKSLNFIDDQYQVHSETNIPGFASA